MFKTLVKRKYKRRFLELDTFSKMKYEKENPINWSTTKFKICNFKLSVGCAHGPESNEMTYFYFIVKKEHRFLRNIYNKEELKTSRNIENIKNNYESFRRFIAISILMNEFSKRDSNIEYIDHDCIENFIENYLDSPNSFDEIFYQIELVQIKNWNWSKKQKKKLYQTISFIYLRIMCFPKNKFEIFTVVTKTFISNFINLMYRKIILHHSQVTRQIIGFGQDFCNQKVRESKTSFPC